MYLISRCSDRKAVVYSSSLVIHLLALLLSPQYHRSLWFAETGMYGYVRTRIKFWYDTMIPHSALPGTVPDKPGTWRLDDGRVKCGRAGSRPASHCLSLNLQSFISSNYPSSHVSNDVKYFHISSRDVVLSGSSHRKTITDTGCAACLCVLDIKSFFLPVIQHAPCPCSFLIVQQ